MNNLPPFVYAKAFWTAVSWALAGVCGLLVYFGVLPPQFGWPAATILAGILSVLNFFGIVPELRLTGGRGLLRKE